MSQIPEEMNEMKEVMKTILKASVWTEPFDDHIQMVCKQLIEYPLVIKTEWVTVDFVEEENKIELLWEELQLFLEDDEDFQILQINNDSMKIKALNPMAFRKEYVYCKILSNIIPINCKLDLNSYFDQADLPENDTMVFDLSINSERNLYYKGRIKIVK